MSESEGLFLPSLRVEGVRAIRELEIGSLGRVNLFVGANNAGKTSLLEALRLYASRGIRQAFRDALQTRGYVFSTFLGAPLEELGVLFEAVQSLFHGGWSSAEDLSIRVGPVGGELPQLLVGLEWRGTDPSGRSSQLGGVAPTLLVRYGDERSNVMIAELAVSPHPYIENQVPFAVFVPPGGIDGDRLGTLWDRVTLTEWEAEILNALKIIVPRLQGISFIVEGRRRVPVAKMEDVSVPVPLRNMGDGVNRLLSLALAMVNSRGGFLLVDEFENGLYYGVQREVWAVIFALAERLNVQVFATTHSWDAVVGFQDAANRSAAEGILYRLDREEDGRIHPVRYTEEEIAIAADQQIEVR